MIVLDANILVRAALGRRVRTLLENYSARGVQFFAPEVAFEDAATYLPGILARRGKPLAEIAPTFEYLRQIIRSVEHDFYILFERDARTRLRGRDEDDWPVLAAALALGCPIWTEDADFFGTGIAVWTTSRIEIFLEAQMTGLHREAED
ncbi:MAG: PIN domain-containing protein [Candidatus Acidiferrales bacterium]